MTLMTTTDVDDAEDAESVDLNRSRNPWDLRSTAAEPTYGHGGVRARSP